MKIKPSCRSSSAFSLVELLVVIAIISLLVSLTLPSLRAAREAAIQARCGVQLRQAGVTLMTYAYDHKEWAPSMTIFARPTTYYNTETNWVDNYFTTDKQNLRCPADAPYGSDKVVGGMKWKSAIFSSYVLLFGLGHVLNATNETGDDVDTWYGWRIQNGPYVPVPRISLMGGERVYMNPTRKVRRTYTLLAPAEQAIAADTWSPIAADGAPRLFLGAGPGSADGQPDNYYRPIMHSSSYSDGVNILYGDGHVGWKNGSQLIGRTRMGSGGPWVYW